MFIVVEGDDRTGKDTLISGICKATQWERIIIPRGPAGYAAYDIIYRVLHKKCHIFSVAYVATPNFLKQLTKYTGKNYTKNIKCLQLYKLMLI